MPSDECEFHFPDEERFYPLPYYPCPICGGLSDLHCAKINDAIAYQVQCSNKECGYKTEWRKSSAEATRIWKVTAILHNK